MLISSQIVPISLYSCAYFIKNQIMINRSVSKKKIETQIVVNKKIAGDYWFKIRIIQSNFMLIRENIKFFQNSSQ